MYAPRQALGFIRKIGLPLCLAFLLTACAGHHSSSANADPNNPSLAESTASSTFNDAMGAVTSPLDDIGLREKPIPAALVEIVDNPYLEPTPKTCATIKDEIDDLNTLLGDDVDAPKVILTDEERAERTGASILHDGIVGIVKSRLSFLPFRGVIRKITGAERHEHEMNEAMQAGRLRRAYLKGLAQASFGSHCKTGPVILEVKKTPTQPESVATSDDADNGDAIAQYRHVQVASK